MTKKIIVLLMFLAIPSYIFSQDEWKGPKMMGGYLPIGIPESKIPEYGTKRANLVFIVCTQCHEMPSPKMHTKAEWPAVLVKMYKHINHMSDQFDFRMPSEQGKEKILSYFLEYAMPPAPDDIPLHTEVGKLFVENCSDCHTLPSPNLHTADEWEVTASRMQENRKKMGKAEIPPESLDKILTLLKKYSKKD